ncbi:hypothetical protein HK102_003312 [Quaeritorhiza haematococci]|nr:hypothetical protein HK102_003312 [Quaeritorhiza haematococci]
MSEKNLRLKVHKRRQMAALLKRGIQKFSVYQMCLLLWLMALTGVAYGLSVYVFGTAEENVSGLIVSMRMGRRSTELDERYRRYDEIEVVRPPRTVPTVQEMNAYEMLSALVDSGRYMFYEITDDYRYDFVIRNIGTIRDFLFTVGDDGEEEYRSKIQFGIVLMSVRDQIQYLKAFALVPKKDIMNLLVDIDEAIEEITEDMASSEGEEDKEHVDVKALTERNDLKDRVTASYLRNYIAAVVLIALAVMAMLVIPLVRVSAAENTVHTITYVGKRRPYIVNINYYATEITLQEDKYWHPREAEMQMDFWIRILEELHKNSVTGSGKKQITALSSIPALSTLLTTSGKCARSKADGCDVATRDPPYVPEIGYTRELVLQPVDTLMNRFLAEAQMFLENRAAMPDEQALQRNLTDFLFNPHLLLMRGIMEDVIEGFDQVQDIMFNLIDQDNRMAEQQVTIIMGLTFGLALVVYVLIFSRFSRQRLTSADEIVNLLFLIPQQVVDGKSELKRFFESAGLSGLSET